MLVPAAEPEQAVQWAGLLTVEAQRHAVALLALVQATRPVALAVPIAEQAQKAAVQFEAGRPA